MVLPTIASSEFSFGLYLLGLVLTFSIYTSALTPGHSEEPIDSSGVSTGHYTVQVINDNGGTLQPGDFTISIEPKSGNGTVTPDNFRGDGSTTVEYTGGGYFEYQIDQPGYSPSFGNDCPPGNFPRSFSCTIILDDIPPAENPSQIQSLAELQAHEPTTVTNARYIVKVINDNGGKATPSDFTIKLYVISGPGTITPSSFRGEDSPGTLVTYNSVGGYSNYGVLPNEEPGYIRTPGPDCPVPGTTFPATLPCTAIYDDIAHDTSHKSHVDNSHKSKTKPQTEAKTEPNSHVQQWPVGRFIVQVKNDNGGSKQPNDFKIELVGSNGGTPNPSSFTGSESGTDVQLVGNGYFDLAANKEPGYTRSLGSDCPTGEFPQTFTCTLKYDDFPAVQSKVGSQHPVEPQPSVNVFGGGL